MAENPIRRTTGKGGNYRKTKTGAGMTRRVSQPTEEQTLEVN